MCWLFNAKYKCAAVIRCYYVGSKKLPLVHTLSLIHI